MGHSARPLILIAALLAAPGLFAQELPSQAVERAHQAYGGRWRSGQIQDWVARGTLSYWTVAGPQATFDVTLARKGPEQVQRTVWQGTTPYRLGVNGRRNWDSRGGQVGAAASRRARGFLQSQSFRSLESLFAHESRGLKLGQLKQQGNKKALDAKDGFGRKTTYFIDDDTSLITRLEFEVGRSKDAVSGRRIPDVEAYVFSDFRTVEGAVFPFKIERYVNAVKIEEMRLSSIELNVGLSDAEFRP